MRKDEDLAAFKKEREAAPDIYQDGILAELEKLLDVPFVFWTCPKKCRGYVKWTTFPDKSMQARCETCGELSGIYNKP